MSSLNFSKRHMVLNLDSVGGSSQFKDSVRVSTTAPLTLASDFEAGDTIDGIILNLNDRILIKDQASGVENGIYIVTTTSPVRATDMAVGSSSAGSIVFVEEGTLNKDTGWIVTNNSGSDIVGTDALVFSNFSGSSGGTTGQYKSSVRVASQVAGVLANDYENGDVVDNVTLVTGDRILIKNQTVGTENGIYTVNASGNPTRANDLPSTSSATNIIISVEEGTANGDATFICTNNSGSDIVGTDSLVFKRYIDSNLLPDVINNNLRTATVTQGVFPDVSVTNVTCWLNGEFYSPADNISLTLTVSSTNFIYVNSSGVITNLTTAPTGTFILISVIKTDATTFTDQRDLPLIPQLNRTFDAVVAQDGTGDYSDPVTPFANGAKSVYVKNGTYLVTGIINIPDGGALVGESKGVIFDLQLTNSNRISSYGQGGTSPVESFYDGGGTIDITGSLSTVTGTGTTFLTAVTPVVVGQFLIIRGAPYIISAISSDTSLTIGQFYGGITEVGIAFPDYVILPMNQNLVLTNFSVIRMSQSGTNSGLHLVQCINTTMINVDFSQGSTGAGRGIELKTCCNCTVDKLTSVGGGAVFGFRNGWRNTIINSSFTGAVNNGILFANSTGGLPNLKHKIISCTLEGMGTISNGINLGSVAERTLVVGNIINNIDGDGIVFTYSSPTHHQIFGNVIDNVTSNAISTGTGGNDVIIGNHITNVTSIGIDVNGANCLIQGNDLNIVTGVGIQLDGATCVVAENHIKASVGNSIQCNVSNNTIIGNKITDSGADSIVINVDDVIVQNNCINNSTTFGIVVGDTGNVSRVRVFNNLIIGSGSHGIQIDAVGASTITDIEIVGNHLSTNVNGINMSANVISGIITRNSFFANTGSDYNSTGTATFSGLNNIIVGDNIADAYTIQSDDGNIFLRMVTTNSSESITFFQDVIFPHDTSTQITSITTGVTVNSASGVIITVSATLAANASATFTVTNSSVTTSSVIRAGIQDYSGTFSTNGIPVISVDNRLAGSFDITISNAHSANALSGVLQISFIIV